MSEKKDLTNIEDLGEFIHELNSEEEKSSSFELESFSETTSSFETEPEVAESFNFEESLPPSEESSLEESSTSDDTPDFSDSAQELEFGTSESESEAVQESKIENENIIDPLPPVEEAEVLPQDKIEEDEIYFEKEIPISQESPAPAVSEDFSDLKAFSESSVFSPNPTAEANPSYSVLLKNVKYIEDVNDIATLLKELELLQDEEEVIKSRLMRGMLLISRISEFSAIFLAHKLRRFNIDLQIGLSDEIHASKHQETPETGIVSKHNLYQNYTHSFHFDNPRLELSQIIISATPNLEGHQVIRYMGVASEHKMLDSHIVEDESSEEIPFYYQELAEKLKAHALKANSNAIIGLNYQLTPIPSELGVNHHKYRLTCTGNLVWVNKL